MLRSRLPLAIVGAIAVVALGSLLVVHNFLAGDSEPALSIARGPRIADDGRCLELVQATSVGSQAVAEGRVGDRDQRLGALVQ